MPAVAARTNHEVFVAFVAGQSASSGNVRSERLSNGWTILYSYSTPIAIRGDGAIVVDDRRYSVTTSKQTSGTVLPAYQAGLSWDRIPHERFRAMCANVGADLRYAR